MVQVLGSLKFGVLSRRIIIFRPAELDDGCHAGSRLWTADHIKSYKVQGLGPQGS